MAGEIRRGHIFHGREAEHWQSLSEGHGVVVVRQGVEFIAYGDSHDASHPEGSDALRKNLAGAKNQNGSQAFLVVKKNGRLIWRTEAEAKPGAPKRVTVVLPWRQKKFRFSESDNNVA